MNTLVSTAPSVTRIESQATSKSFCPSLYHGKIFLLTDTRNSQTRAGVSSAHEPESEHHTVIEPHTGLPMNVEKYGSGAGGVDGSNTVEGYHQVPGQQADTGVTDWEGIKKANTPY